MLTAINSKFRCLSDSYAIVLSYPRKASSASSKEFKVEIILGASLMAIYSGNYLGSMNKLLLFTK